MQYSPAAAPGRRTRGVRRLIASVTVAGAALAPMATSAGHVAAEAATTTSGTHVVWASSARPHVRAVKSRAARTVGTSFKVTQTGDVTHLRFFKAKRNRGQHVASLWTSGGRRLASVTFRKESRYGWQSARLSTPVHLSAGSTYVASYVANRGRYSQTAGAFSSGRTVGRSPLIATGGLTGGRSGFPSARTSSAMFVDVAFRPTAGASTPTAPSAPVSVPKPTPTGFPSAANTGANGSLASRAGGTITTDGAVIANTVINGQLTVRADNVTLRNVYIKTGGSYGLLTYGKNTVIQDSTIVGTPASTTAGILAYDTGQVIARRVDVSNSEDGVRLGNNSVLEDSYVHDLNGTASAHYDSVTADGFTGWRIQHNTILNDRDQTAVVWIGDRRYGPSEGVLADNYLAGGGYSIYAGPGGGAGLRVTGNVFSTKYFADSGKWGPVCWWESSRNTWSGNTWADGPRAGQTVAP